MSIDDEYAAIGIDLRRLRRDSAVKQSGDRVGDGRDDDDADRDDDDDADGDDGWLELGQIPRVSAAALAENPVEVKVGRAILRLRLYWGWSQAELGRRSGLDQTTISRLERGRQEGLAIRRFFAILRALQVGEIVMLPRPPAAPMTSLELMLSGDPWKRAINEADRRLNRRRTS